eukprot:6197873-Pleurochrysis_carterae.AAC.5
MSVDFWETSVVVKPVELTAGCSEPPSVIWRLCLIIAYILRRMHGPVSDLIAALANKQAPATGRSPRESLSTARQRATGWFAR